MTEARTPSPEFPRVTLFFTVFLDLAGFGMILPLLPFYAQRYGADAFQVGLLFSVYSLSQAIGAPFLGRISDRFGRRPILLITVAGHGLSLVLFALAGNFTVLLVARIAAGIFAANFSIAQAYVADVTPPETRAKGMGLVGAALGMGFVVGPGLGGLLSFFGQVAVPLGAAVLAAVNFAMIFQALPESLKGTARRRPARWNPIRGLREIGAPTGTLLVVFFLIIVAFSAMEGTLALFCEAVFGFGVAETSVLLVMIGIVIAIVQGGLLGRLVERFGERGLVRVGIALMALGLLGVPLSAGGEGHTPTRESGSTGGEIRDLGREPSSPVLDGSPEPEDGMPPSRDVRLSAGAGAEPPASPGLAEDPREERSGSDPLRLGVVALLLLGLASILLAVGNGVCNPSLLGLISRLTEAERQGQTLGLTRSLGALARTVGPLWGGWVFREMGPSWPYYLASILMLGTLALAAFFLRRLPLEHRVPASSPSSEAG
ncbi:MAG: MFS transporter [Thermoanaerobaculia bacterium]|nr:MFS transporter [Thermoanaerobaculia bacterium]